MTSKKIVPGDRSGFIVPGEVTLSGTALLGERRREVSQGEDRFFPKEEWVGQEIKARIL